MLQLRDLRLLDPQLATSYPSAILARERALVVNLEYIKCIITQDCVLLLNPGAHPTPYTLYPAALHAGAMHADLRGGSESASCA